MITLKKLFRLFVVVPIAPLVGFVGGLSSVGLALRAERPEAFLLTRILANPLFTAAIFGVVIAAYLKIFFRVPSVLKAVIFIFSCSVAYYLSVIVTIRSSIFFKADLAVDKLWGISPFSFFLGGTAGAFCILFAALFLFSYGNRLPHIILNSALGSLAGGLLGPIGWSLGPSLGRMFRPEGDLTSACLSSLHLIWQTGMGFVFGLLFYCQPRPELKAAHSQSPASAHSARIVRIAGLIFGMAAILLIVRASFVDISREIKAARWAQEYTRHAAEKPSTQNLPKIALQQPEAVVIMAPIAGLRPATPYPSGIHYADGGPDPVGFRVIYALEKQSSSKHDLEPSAAVSIGEYPNAEWAKYRSGDMLMGGSQINKFGSQILAQTRFAPNTGYSYFQWPSDGWVVTLTVYRVEPEEFLKAYLAKYPSSLQ